MLSRQQVAEQSSPAEEQLATLELLLFFFPLASTSIAKYRKVMVRRIANYNFLDINLKI